MAKSLPIQRPGSCLGNPCCGRRCPHWMYSCLSMRDHFKTEMQSTRVEQGLCEVGTQRWTGAVSLRAQNLQALLLLLPPLKHGLAPWWCSECPHRMRKQGRVWARFGVQDALWEGFTVSPLQLRVQACSSRRRRLHDGGARLQCIMGSRC